jgi:hypothetical protein
LLTFALVVSLLCAVAARASAQTETFEEERTSQVVSRAGYHVVPAAEAEGKRVAFIRVTQEDVFVEDELWPDLMTDDWIPLPNHLPLLNAFHWLTDADIVAREVLLSVGRPYRGLQAAETTRILRTLGIFSLVKVVPVRTERDDEVGVVVYTRDLWSLRLEQRCRVSRSAASATAPSRSSRCRTHRRCPAPRPAPGRRRRC